MEKVSIIVPVYNKQEQLRLCLKSIIGQTYKNIEIICIDDGSTDNSLKVLHDLQKQDDRIIVLKKSNGGPSSARNVGLNHSSGKYIQFVDCDDTISNNMTETLVSSIKNTNSDLVICGYTFEDDYVSFGTNATYVYGEFIKLFSQLYVSKLINSPCNKIYKKDILSKFSLCFDENVCLGEDLIFNIKYLQHISSVSIINDKLYNINHCTNNSITSSFRKGDYQNLEFKNDILFRYIENMKIGLTNEIATSCINDYMELTIRLIYSHRFNLLSEFKSANDIKKSKYVEKNLSLYQPESFSEMLYSNNLFLFVLYVHLKRVIKNIILKK